MPITPQLKKAAKATQFGTKKGDLNKIDNMPDAKYAKWDLRNAQRYFAAQPIDLNDKQAIKKLIKGRNPSIAEAIVLKQISKAIGGDNRAIEAVTDNVCGSNPLAINMGGQKDNPIVTVTDKQIISDYMKGDL
jgi:hypothetical protein